MPNRKTIDIQKRGVFFIGGFDPKSAEQFFTRNRRETNRFETLWDVSVSNQEPVALNQDVTLTKYDTQPADKNWTVTTDFHFLTLDDVVLKDFSQPFLTRLWRYTVTFADYLLSGTAVLFFKTAWRFALYFSYPAFMLLLFTAISLALTGFIGNLGFSFSWGLGLIFGAAAFWCLMTLIGKRYHVLHLMDLWSFSRDFIYANRHDIKDKLSRMADMVARQAAENDYDEILLVGHSTGGALILDVAGRTVEQHPDFLKTRGAINVLTVGSTALKIGLHPKANWFRKRVGNAFASGKLCWVEYQCLTDIINFYRTDPAKLMKLEISPSIGKIKIRKMLEKETYRRIKRNFFRVHYQFVFGNTKRYHYDFPAICFGPAPLSQRANHPDGFNTYLTGSPTKI